MGSAHNIETALRTIHTVNNTVDSYVDQAKDKLADPNTYIDATREVAQVTQDASSGVEAFTLGITISTAGTSAPVTGPVAATAGLINTGASVVEASCDLAQGGDLSSPSIANSAINMSTAGLGRFFNAAVDWLKIEGSHPFESSAMVKAIGDSVLETGEKAAQSEVKKE